MRRAVVRSTSTIWATLWLTLVLAGCGEGLLSGGDPGLVQDDAGVLPPESTSDGMELELDGGPPLLDGKRPDGELPAEDAAAPDPDAGASAAGTCPQVKITTDGRPANVRPAPNTSGAPVGTLQNGDIVDVLAITQGETLDGLSTWYKIKSGTLVGYVFETLAACTTQPAPAPTPTPPKSGFYLPFPCGKKVKVTQGNNTSFSHTGLSKYAFDFSLGIGTKMLAMAPGKVSYVYNKTKPGDPCYSGGGPSCITKANLVWVKHADGTQTIYAHLSSVAVSVGQKVSRGQKLGLSGSSGYSTGPHAHVARMKTCCQTIPLKFQDVPGTGVPKTGDYVTSGNCP